MEKDLDKKIQKLLNSEEDTTSFDKEQLKQLNDYIKTLKDEEESLNEEIKHQVAENRNMSKRHDDRETSLRKYSASKLGELIVPDIDLLKKVVESAENIDSPEVKNYLVGFQMVLSKMENTLSEVGIKQTTIKLGDEFDASIEESIEKVDSDKYKSGEIVEIVSNGYMIHDHVLIHAKVKVAK